jgi:hypothetical protein
MAAEEVHHEVLMCSNPRRMIGTINYLPEPLYITFRCA